MTTFKQILVGTTFKFKYDYEAGLMWGYVKISPQKVMCVRCARTEHLGGIYHTPELLNAEVIIHEITPAVNRPNNSHQPLEE